MKVILLNNDTEIELLDKDITFVEGEQVIVDGNPKRVESVHKVVSVTGSSADLSYRVVLR